MVSSRGEFHVSLFAEDVRERVAKQYVPGVSEVDSRRGLLRQASDNFQKKLNKDSEAESAGENIFKSDDGKWRPVLATLGKKL